MSRRTSRIACASLLALTLPVIVGAGPTALEGEYRLVDQRYGDGGANLVEDEASVRIRIERSAAGAVATLTAGGSAPHPWPAFVTDGGALAIEMIERRDDEAACALHARYRVRPSDDLTLEIVEDYRCAEGGKALVGTYTASFLARDADGGLSPRGSYTLHRRFEREP
jgi:hypothetical protein